MSTTQPKLTFNDLTTGFKEVGLCAGDMVLVHSSYKSFGGVEGGPSTVIDALLDVLTEQGTLIMPTFNFGFCGGEPYDVKNTPSKMGILTELVRTHPDSVTIPHPFYSFAVLGAQKEALGKIDAKDAYSNESMLGQLAPLGAKIMVIGLEYNMSMTYFHHVETIQQVDYRYYKDFTGTIIDADDNESTQTYPFFVRDLEKGVLTQVNPMGELLESQGFISSHQIGNATIKLMLAQDIYDHTVIEMQKDPFLLYEIEKK